MKHFGLVFPQNTVTHPVYIARNQETAENRREEKRTPVLIPTFRNNSVHKSKISYAISTCTKKCRNDVHENLEKVFDQANKPSNPC